MKKLVYLTIGILIITGLFFIKTTDINQQMPKQQAQNTIELSFATQTITEVPSIVFDNKWNLRKKIQLSNVSGVEKVLILFYETSEGWIKLILQDKNSFYDLGMEAMPENSEAIVKDINNDGANELIISANLGATVKAVKILTYNGEKWLYILAGENLTDVDLDEDGISEFVETSMGSLPGYVNIYRWNNSQFEKSELLKDSGYNHITFVIKDNKPLFELTKDNKAYLYKYQKGKLEPEMNQ